jgi:hypothetical protein
MISSHLHLRQVQVLRGWLRRDSVEIPTKQSPTRGGDCFAILRPRRQKNGGSAHIVPMLFREDGSQ